MLDAHSVPLSAGGLNFQPNFQKGGTWKVLYFYREVAGKEGVTFFYGGGGGCNFTQKNKLKSEIFYDKKSL